MTITPFDAMKEVLRLRNAVKAVIERGRRHGQKMDYAQMQDIYIALTSLLNDVISDNRVKRPINKEIFWIRLERMGATEFDGPPPMDHQVNTWLSVTT